MFKKKIHIKGLLPVVTNKYFIASLAFIVWIVFFDNNNFISQYKLIKELKGLKTEREFHITEIQNDRAYIKELLGSQEKIEKFGREEYLMKRPDENIFLIVDKEKEDQKNKKKSKE